MSLRSLRWQIQLWHAALLVVLVATTLAAFYSYERRARVARVDAELTGPLVALLPRHIRLPGNRRPPGPLDNSETLAVERNLEAAGHYLYIRDSRGEVLYASPERPASIPEPEKKPGVMTGRWNGPHRELVSFSPRGDLVILARMEHALAADMRSFTLRLSALGAGVIILGLLGGHLVTGRALRPLGSIAHAARRIASGHWNERIPETPAPAELAELRAVLNDSFTRLAALHEQQRRFTADASHELGTPVAIVLAQTQHALARPRTPEEYAAALAACRRAGERMKALNRDLLDLAAYDSGATTPRRVECDLAELARESLSLVAPLATSRQATLVEQLDPLPARVDPLGLSQVLVNLLTNALVHNAPGLTVTLSVRRDPAAPDHALLTVADTGAGIPPEALPNLFERFFRADPARTRDAGGSGLGLAIARRIATLHDGELTATNRPEGGALFTLRLPLSV